tara:strand:- start:75191 stop:76108 length:918 start_codon:yes stop_codon:yes gene_type:complete
MALSCIALGAVSLSTVGCSKPGEDSEAKRTPIPEPAPNVDIPSKWSVPLEAGNAEKRVINAAMLGALTPDFADDERTAWRLDKLLSDSEFPLGALIEAVGADGVGIAMRRQKDPDAPVPVIVLTRRGDIVAAAVKASDPFPDYHGQGGRLKRPGDPLPRLISPLARLRVSHSGAGDDAADEPATIEGLRIQIGDNPANRIPTSVLASVPSSTVMGDSGNKKTVWNVRDLVAASSGESAVLTAVSGEEMVEVSAEEWSNMDLRPILQLNRRGQLKFHWQDTTVASDKAGDEGHASVHSVRLLKVKR